MKFPKKFLFGSATSAHQIEGYNFNSDWYNWEQKPGNIADSSTSEVAVDSWNKWKEDIKLLKSTGQNAYRFSIEWAKIEPKPGKFDQEVIDHYRTQLLELKKNNIKSMVTLFHFSLPAWVAVEGGFLNSNTISHFARFSAKMSKEYTDLVDLWAILNEPNVYALKSYIQGVWCPAHKSWYQGFIVWKNLIKAHNAAFSEMKKVNPHLKIGIVMNMAAFFPYQNKPINRFLVFCAKILSYDLFLRITIKRMDFLGINYYMKFILQSKKPLTRPIFDKGYNWSVPEAIYNVIMQNLKWQKPIYITENGIADSEDKYRFGFIKKSLEAIAQAIDEGADVRGYFHWSLLDCFEWSSGYSVKFGLFDIHRKPKRSVFVYANLIKKFIN